MNTSTPDDNQATINNDTMEIIAKVKADNNMEHLSTIPEIKIPEFKRSEIIDTLLREATTPTSRREEYLLTTVDKLGQSVNWMMNVLSDLNKQARKTNGNIIVLKAWKERYANDIAETIDKTKEHELLLHKTSFLKKVLIQLLVAAGSAATGILAWISLFQTVIN